MLHDYNWKPVEINSYTQWSYEGKRFKLVILLVNSQAANYNELTDLTQIHFLFCLAAYLSSFLVFKNPIALTAAATVWGVILEKMPNSLLI